LKALSKYIHPADSVVAFPHATTVSARREWPKYVFIPTHVEDNTNAAMWQTSERKPDQSACGIAATRICYNAIGKKQQRCSTDLQPQRGNSARNLGQSPAKQLKSLPQQFGKKYNQISARNKYSVMKIMSDLIGPFRMQKRSRFARAYPKVCARKSGVD